MSNLVVPTPILTRPIDTQIYRRQICRRKSGAIFSTLNTQDGLSPSSTKISDYNYLLKWLSIDNKIKATLPDKEAISLLRYRIRLKKACITIQRWYRNMRIIRLKYLINLKKEMMKDIHISLLYRCPNGILYIEELEKAKLMFSNS